MLIKRAPMRKILLLILIGVGSSFSSILCGQNTLKIQIEVPAVGYYWGEETYNTPYSAMASLQFGGSPLPTIQANLADYDFIEFTVVAPEGMRFKWDPSDGEGGYYESNLVAQFYYGASAADQTDVQDVSLTFIDYEGAPLPHVSFDAAIFNDGKAFWLYSCGCGGEMEGEAYFKGFVITIDYSNIVTRTDWAEQSFEAQSGLGWGIGLNIPLAFEESPGQHLSLVPVPEPGTYAVMLGVLSLVGVVAWRRRML